MNSPSVVYILRCLASDTFRQAKASAVFWFMLGASALFIIACLSVSIDGATPLKHEGELPEFLPRNAGVDLESAHRYGVDIISGRITLGFGLFQIDLGRDAEDSVRFIQLCLAGGVADTAGILFALLWTAGFVPGFLESGSAELLFSKPVPRWLLLAGKCLGVLLFVAFQATVFIGGTWLALGIKTGIWHPAYLLCLPVLLIHFAVFFSVSALIAVFTRSTIVTMLGSLAFWFICWSVDFTYLTRLAAQSESAGLWSSTLTVSYWILPKPADLNFILQEFVESTTYFNRAPELMSLRLETIGAGVALLTSTVFMAVVLLVAGRRLRAVDY